MTLGEEDAGFVDSYISVRNTVTNIYTNKVK